MTIYPDGYKRPFYTLPASLHLVYLYQSLLQFIRKLRCIMSSDTLPSNLVALLLAKR